MKSKFDKFYKPIIKKNVKISGITTETIPNGKHGKICTKSFIMSSDDRFFKYATELISFFLGNQGMSAINRLLIVIKKDCSAKIYNNFPLTILFRAKENIKAGRLVTSNQIADIQGVEFKDALGEVNITDGDQILWLTREKWRFGLYFDFSKTLKRDTVSYELGIHYRQLLFYDMYSFLKNQSNLDSLLADGWFPFMQLIGSPFESLQQYYFEEKKYESYINKILDEFSTAKIKAFSNNWWSNQYFNDKKKIIEAGIDAYCQNSSSGFINCIKNLYSEIEGVIRTQCTKETENSNPTTKKIKDFVLDKGNSRFSSDSLGFPSLFYKYLNDVFFKGFNLETGEIDLSRHSVSHGVASFENYDKIRAFQAILILDQIYFFMGKTS